MDQLVLMNEVNLSHNQLTSLDECNMLQCVKVLNASNNNLRCITKRHGLRLASLQELSLSNNSILWKILVNDIPYRWAPNHSVVGMTGG